MATLMPIDSGQVMRPPHVLVPLIQQDIEEGNHAAESASMPYYRAAGEKLIEAKASGKMSLPDLYKWADRNFNLKRSTIHLYMDYARATSDPSGRRDFSSLMEFQRHSKPHWRSVQKDALPVRPQAWHAPIKSILEKIDVERLNIRREALKRAEEREAERILGLQLIDIGYKALATKLHPDKGGSRDAMARLNQVRDRLKASA